MISVSEYLREGEGVAEGGTRWRRVGRERYLRVAPESRRASLKSGDMTHGHRDLWEQWQLWARSPHAHVSRPFSLEELSDALAGTGTGIVSGSSGPARAVAGAALAPHVSARNALVSLCSSSAGAGSEHCLRLVSERALPALEPLQLWPDERLLAAARVPYLALHNIHGWKEYVCHECGARYEHPNPLKVHLYLGCGDPAPAAFWRALLAALRRAPAAPGGAGGAGGVGGAGWRGAAPGGAHLCPYCGKAYSRKYGLKIHIRTHTGYRPLRCRYCARAFGDPSNLNKHVRLHSRDSAAAGEGEGGRRRHLHRHLK